MIVVVNETYILVYDKKKPEEGKGADYSFFLSTPTRAEYEQMFGSKQKADKWIKEYHPLVEEGEHLGIDYLLNHKAS